MKVFQFKNAHQQPEGRLVFSFLYEFFLNHSIYHVLEIKFLGLDPDLNPDQQHCIFKNNILLSEFVTLDFWFRGRRAVVLFWISGIFWSNSWDPTSTLVLVRIRTHLLYVQVLQNFTIFSGCSLQMDRKAFKFANVYRYSSTGIFLKGTKQVEVHYRNVYETQVILSQDSGLTSVLFLSKLLLKVRISCFPCHCWFI